MPPYSPTGETRERVYRYVRRRLELGQPPTVREVQEEFGFRAVETARKHLERLVEERRLAKHPRAARGYRLPAEGHVEDLAEARAREVSTIPVPVLGRVAAGGLSEAIEHREGTVVVEGRASGGADELFALRVQGESMIGAGILPGDLVIVLAQPGYRGRSGDIVVALVEDEATVKTLRRVQVPGGRGRQLQLWPENPDFEPIVPPPDRTTILGKVIEVRRHLGRRG